MATIHAFKAARITRDCIKAHGGSVDDTVGDAINAIMDDLVTSVEALKNGKKSIPIIIGFGVEGNMKPKKGRRRGC